MIRQANKRTIESTGSRLLRCFTS